MLKKLKSNRGFTIIEVLIVLAIAALILLIVFLAVPALQRNSRNTQRKTEAARLLAVIQEYTNNNGGALPNAGGADSCHGIATTSPGCAATASPTVAPQIWQLGNFKNIDGFTVLAANTATIQSPQIISDDVREAIFDSGVVCPAPVSGSSTVTPTTLGATSRSIILMYAIENSAGQPVAQCIAS